MWKVLNAFVVLLALSRLRNVCSAHIPSPDGAISNSQSHSNTILVRDEAAQQTKCNRNAKALLKNNAYYKGCGLEALAEALKRRSNGSAISVAPSPEIPFLKEGLTLVFPQNNERLDPLPDKIFPPTAVEKKDSPTEITPETYLAFAAENLCINTCPQEALDAMKAVGEECLKEEKTKEFGFTMSFIALSYDSLRDSLCKRQQFEDPLNSCFESVMINSWKILVPQLEIDSAPPSGVTQDQVCSTCIFEAAKVFYTRFRDDQGYRDSLHKIFDKGPEKWQKPNENIHQPEKFAERLAKACSPNLGIIGGVNIFPF